jgi:hypothetical protein
VPNTSDPEEARRRAEAVEAGHPRPPDLKLPDYPGDLSLSEAINYGKQIAIWNIEEIMKKVKPKPDNPDIPQRAREAKVLAEYERTLGRLVMLEKQYEASKVKNKTYDDARAGFIAKARSLMDRKR